MPAETTTSGSEANGATATAASTFIDKDPIGALLNKNFFNVLLQADRVRGLDKSMLKLLWDKISSLQRDQIG